MNFKQTVQIILVFITMLMVSCDPTKNTDSTQTDGAILSKPDITSLQTIKLPSQFTLNTPGFSTQQTEQSRSIQLAQSAFNTFINDMEFMDFSKFEIAAQFVIFDTLLVDLSPSDTIYPATTIPFNGKLKKLVAPFLEAAGIKPNTIRKYPIGSYEYNELTKDPIYKYSFSQNNDINDEYDRLTIKWSEDKKNVWVKRQLNVPSIASIGKQSITFVYDGKNLTSSISSEFEGTYGGDDLVGPLKNNFMLSMKEDSDAANGGIFFTTTSSNFPESGIDFFKTDTKGYFDFEGGYFEAEYVKPMDWNASPYKVYRESLRVGFDKIGSISFSGYYNELYGTPDGWVSCANQEEPFIPSGTQYSKFSKNFKEISSFLANKTIYKEAFPSDDNIKYYDISGSELGDLYYVFNEKFNSFQAISPENYLKRYLFQPALIYLNNGETMIAYDYDATPDENNQVPEHPDFVHGDHEVAEKFIGIMNGLGDEEVALSVISKTKFDVAEDLYLYQYKTTHPRTFQLSAIYNKESATYKSILSYDDNNASVGFTPDIEIIASGGKATVKDNTGSLLGPIIKNNITQYFIGWDTDKTATTPTYQAGDEISNVIKNITLYAIYTSDKDIIGKIGPAGGYVFYEGTYSGIKYAYELSPVMLEVSGKTWTEANEHLSSLSNPYIEWKFPRNNAVLYGLYQFKQTHADLANLKEGVYWGSEYDDDLANAYDLSIGTPVSIDGISVGLAPKTNTYHFRPVFEIYLDE